MGVLSMLAVSRGAQARGGSTIHRFLIVNSI
jgi:hypothetical protein